MPKIRLILSWLRITDDQGLLSLTNTALFIVLVKLAIAPSLTLVDAGALLLALLHYSGKKIIALKQTKLVSTQTLAVDPRLDVLEKQIESLKSAMVLKTSFR